MMNLSNTNVVSIVEQAIEKALLIALGEVKIPVYISDTNEVKEEMPYIILHGDKGRELILGPVGQGCGYFEVEFTVLYRSHVKPDSPTTRQAVTDAINAFAYNKPVEILNGTDGLTVFGFIPEATGQMQVNSDLKAYEYLTTWRIICTPMDNQ